MLLKSRPFRQPARMRPALLLCLALLTMAVLAARIDYKAVSIGEEDGWILLDLLEHYELSPTMIEALEHGVPLTFVTEVVLEPEEHFFWQAPLARQRLRRTLRYHPLAESYEVHDSRGGTPRFFATREAALLALGDIKDWRIVAADRLQKKRFYRVTVESWHDIGALPLPLRPRAYLTPGWHLSSKVYEWRLQP